MTLKLGHLLGGLFLLLSFSSLAIDRLPSWFPKNDCESTYRNYDFDSDSIPTILGNEGYFNYYKETKRGSCLKEWTVLVYMAADNDLSPYALMDLHEMESHIKGELNLGASSKNVDILVEVDTLRNSGVRRLHIFDTKKEYQDQQSVEDFMTKDESFIESPIVAWFPEKGGEALRSSESRFKRFLSWGVQKYPSKNVMVIIWGHGEGFLGDFKEDRKEKVKEGLSKPPFKLGSRSSNSRLFSEEDIRLESFLELPLAQKFPLKKPFGGIAFDNSDKSFIDIVSLGRILKEWSDKLLEGEPFDIVTFDACLMQSLEVLTEIRASANYLVGSNQIQNYLGLPYRKILDTLNSTSTPTPFEVAKKMPSLAESSYTRGGYQGKLDNSAYRTFTMNSLSSFQLEDNILEHLNRVSQNLIWYLKEEDFRKEELLFILEKAPRFQGESIDIGLFYGLLEMLLYEERVRGLNTARSESLRRSVVAAQEKMREGLLDSRFGPLYFDSREGEFLLESFRGLSLWLPKSAELYELRKEEMGKSELHKSLTLWKDFMKVIFNRNIFDLGPL